MTRRPKVVPRSREPRRGTPRLPAFSWRTVTGALGLGELGRERRTRRRSLVAGLAGDQLDWAQQALTTLDLHSDEMDRMCLAIRAKAEPEAWSRFNTMSLLGEALLGQGRHAEAEPLVVSGYEGLKAREASIPPQARSRLDEAAERVVRLYEAWGKPAQAAAWKAKLGLADLPKDVFARP